MWLLLILQIYCFIARSNEEILREISECVDMAAPDPHAFLIVLQLTRFHAENEQIVEMIHTMFGEEAAEYTMVLLTHGDYLMWENIKIEDLLQRLKTSKTHYQSALYLAEI